VGPDNWLFYRSVVDRETPAIEQISRDARRASVARIERLSKLLEQRGIQLHVMPLALKHRYYPEFLPASASHALRFRYYDQFMDDLIANGGVRVVDSRKPLQEAKRDGLRIFHKTDFHWTDPAGARVFRELLRRIADAEGQSTLPDTWRYEVVEREVIGGQGRAMPLLRSPREQSIALALQAPLTRFENNTGSSEFLWSATAAPGQGPLLPPMLVWGDSFLDAGVRAGFFNFFSAISRGRIYQMSLVNAYQQRHPGTRHLLIEWITSATVAVDNEVAALVAALEAESPAAPGP
jgi:hypothetical protein